MVVYWCVVFVFGFVNFCCLIAFRSVWVLWWLICWVFGVRCCFAGGGFGIRRIGLLHRFIDWVCVIGFVLL